MSARMNPSISDSFARKSFSSNFRPEPTWLLGVKYTPFLVSERTSHFPPVGSIRSKLAPSEVARVQPSCSFSKRLSIMKDTRLPSVKYSVTSCSCICRAEAKAFVSHKSLNLLFIFLWFILDALPLRKNRTNAISKLTVSASPQFDLNWCLYYYCLRPSN